MTNSKPQIQKFRDHHSVIFLYSNLVLYYNLASTINWEKEIKSIEIQKEENKTLFAVTWLSVWKISKNLQKSSKI